MQHYSGRLVPVRVERRLDASVAVWGHAPHCRTAALAHGGDVTQNWALESCFVMKQKPDSGGGYGSLRVLRTCHLSGGVAEGAP
jgi:hypothetical protein